jgi:uncharacterized protein YxjI
MLSLGDDYWIEDDQGAKIEVEGGPELKAHSHVIKHDYKIERGEDRVALVSKKWFRIHDSYGVEIEPGQNDALILAAVVAIEHMSRDVG